MILKDPSFEKKFKISNFQIELDEKETSEPVPLTEEALLDRLIELPYKLFVLSEYGRPIYAS